MSLSDVKEILKIASPEKKKAIMLVLSLTDRESKKLLYALEERRTNHA